jgi:5-hydroxyisourate hydrolase
MSAITTHVLDTTAGRPAAGVPVLLERRTPEGWQREGSGVTDADGRLRTLLPADVSLAAGEYRITFDTRARSAFYPSVSVQFTVDDPVQHYHVPLLLSPFGYSTYRGS